MPLASSRGDYSHLAYPRYTLTEKGRGLMGCISGDEDMTFTPANRRCSMKLINRGTANLVSASGASLNQRSDHTFIKHLDRSLGWVQFELPSTIRVLGAGAGDDSLGFTNLQHFIGKRVPFKGCQSSASKSF